MAVERHIGALDGIAVRSNPNNPQVRVNDTDPIGFDVSGLIDGNTDVLVYLAGLSLEARLTKAQARRLADLLIQAADL